MNDFAAEPSEKPLTSRVLARPPGAGNHSSDRIVLILPVPLGPVILTSSALDTRGSAFSSSCGRRPPRIAHSRSSQRGASPPCSPRELDSRPSHPHQATASPCIDPAVESEAARQQPVRSARRAFRIDRARAARFHRRLRRGPSYMEGSTSEEHPWRRVVRLRRPSRNGGLHGRIILCCERLDERVEAAHRFTDRAARSPTSQCLHGIGSGPELEGGSQRGTPEGAASTALTPARAISMPASSPPRIAATPGKSRAARADSSSACSGRTV